MADENKAVSLDKLTGEIRDCWYEAFPMPGGEMAQPTSGCSYVVEVFDAYVIVCFDDDYYRVGYTLDDQGEAMFAPRQDWAEVESVQAWVDKVEEMKAAKVGSRNNAEDKARIRNIRQCAKTIIDHTNNMEPDDGEETPPPEDKPAEKPAKGNALKAVFKTADELRVANYIVLFGKRDLEGLGSQRVNADGSIGERFDPTVDVESDYTKTGVLYVDWEHGQDPDNVGAGEHDVLGYVDWKTAKRDERGIFVERVLNRRNKYMQWLEGLIEEGLISNSSEATSATKTADGVITRWPLKRDSLTVNPMQWQNLQENTVQALKALGVEIKTDGSAAQKPPEAAGNAAVVVPEPNLSVTQKEVKAMEWTDEKIQALVTSTAKSAVEEYRKSAPAVDTSGVVVTLDEADRPFISLADQCKAVMDCEITKGRKFDPRLSRLAKAPLGGSEGIAADGGFTLEPTLASDVLTPLHDEGPFYPSVRKLPVSTNSNYGWINGVNETSRVDGSRWGGIQGYWAAEAATMTSSKPAFKRINWNLQKLFALCYATDELLQDSAQFAAVVRMGVGEELRFKVNDAILNGSGVGRPEGMLVGPGLVVVAKEVGQGADTIVNENLMKMWARVHPRSKGKATWYYNTDCGPQLHQLALAAGAGALPPRFVTYADDGSLRIYGRPAVETEFNATLGDQGDIAVLDPAEYLYWEKGGVQEASSIHLQFLTDETVFRFIMRCDGHPAVSTALTPYKGSNTLSPYVTLAAR